jgi:hypothetical protein
VDGVSFGDYRLISYCNVVYKIMEKVISRSLKPTLSEIISEEEFSFLQHRQIHDAFSITQEVFHSIKKSNQKDVIFKLDLAKSYKRVNWICMHVILL